MARKRSRSRKSSSSSSFSGIAMTGVGVAAYILFEAYAEPRIVAMTGLSPTIVNVVELAAGAYLARKGGVIGSAGKAAVVINIYQLLQPMLSGSISSYN